MPPINKHTLLAEKEEKYVWKNDTLPFVQGDEIAQLREMNKNRQVFPAQYNPHRLNTL